MVLLATFASILLCLSKASLHFDYVLVNSSFLISSKGTMEICAPESKVIDNLNPAMIAITSFGASVSILSSCMTTFLTLLCYVWGTVGICDQHPDM